MTLGPGHVQTQWMRLLVATLEGCGIKHFVVSPGSRSTPIVAALQRANLRLHLCVDERSAGFLALGLARASGKAAALVCTSGTAGAHYYPAVIEAAHSDLPLLVLTADRPPELQDNASAQTIDQNDLFGTYPRGFVEVGVADARLTALRGLRQRLTRAVALTQAPRPGPVHVNIPAYKPLEPQEPTTETERKHAAAVFELAASPVALVLPGRSTLEPRAIEAVVAAWRGAQRPVLFCGPHVTSSTFDAVAAFARQARWPVLAEITHPLRQSMAGDRLLCDAFDVVARARPTELTPDLVVSIGATATSSAWQQWLIETPEVALAAVHPHVFSDPFNRLQLLVQSEPNALFEALLGRLPPAPPSWSAAWANANTTAKELAATSLVAASGSRLTEAETLRDIGATLRDDDILILGNSLPIRVAETFVASSRNYRCSSQRGVNGIDGLIAGALGTALHAGKRTFVVLGDISALHDIGSLQLLSNLDVPLYVCVLDNRGGRIFEDLPVAKTALDLSPWTTPHEHDLAAIARAFGVTTWSVSTRSELGEALTALPPTGPAVLVCRLDPHGAERVYADLNERARRGLRS